MSLNKARVGHSFVSHSGKLYAIGGRSYLDEAQLSDITSMKIAAQMEKEGGLAGLADVSICEGNGHQLTEFLHVVECFDERVAGWREVTLQLPEDDLHKGATAVDRSSFACCLF